MFSLILLVINSTINTTRLQVKQLLLIIFLFLSSIPCYCQVIDSLFNRLNKTEIKQEKVDLWNEISRQQQPIGGLKAAENALKLAREIKYAKGEADANYYLASYHYLKDNQELPKFHLQKALALYDSLDLSEAKIETFILLGEVYYFDEEYATALKYFQQAENIAIQNKDSTLLAIAFENIAYIYIDGLEDNQSGRDYLLRSNDILKKAGISKKLIQNYLGIASFYLRNNEADSALIFLAEGENILSKLDSSMVNIYMRHDFSSLKGTCYAKLGKVDTANFFIEKSLPFFIENENWYSVAWAYTDLSIIASKKGDYKEAISYAKKSIELDITKFSLEENTMLIRDAYKQINQDSFHLYNEKYIELLKNPKYITLANEIQEVLKEEEINQKEEELINEKSSFRHLLIGLLLFLSFAYGLSLYFYYKNLKRKKAVSNFNYTKKPDLTAPKKEAEIDLLREKVHTIERSLLSKELDLERQRLSLDHTTQHLKEIATNNNPLELRKSIQKLSNQLAHNQSSNDQWASFSQQFEQIHPNFFYRLGIHAPNLSTREKRLCAYGKLGMTNQEIAQILGIATSSVGKARHRLKKKMNLEKEQDLNQFLNNL